jgi:hypothetical protein
MCSLKSGRIKYIAGNPNSLAAICPDCFSHHTGRPCVQAHDGYPYASLCQGESHNPAKPATPASNDGRQALYSEKCLHVTRHILL